MAQRRAELRWRRPNGPLLGVLHVGARVKVAPSEGAWARVSGLPFAGEHGEITAYAERAALGTEPRVSRPFEPAGKGRSKRLPPVTGWLDDPEEPQHGSRAAWLGLDCHDSFVGDGNLRQYEAGVELIARDLDNLADRPSVIQEMLRCVARAGSVPLTAVASDPLADLIAAGASVHWLHEAPFEGAQPGALVCDEWRFSRTPPNRGRLTRRQRFEGAVASLPFEYRPTSEQGRATLAFATLEFNRQLALRCECPVDYTLLAASPSVLTLTGHPLPPGATSFDPADAERWFLSAEACESARAEASKMIERDGSVATTLGLHAVSGALGI